MNLGLLYRQTVLALTESDTITANRYIEKYVSIFREKSIPELNDNYPAWAYMHWESGSLEMAEDILQESTVNAAE